MRAVLRELSTRAESVELREDCNRLHKLLDDPIFRRISQKVFLFLSLPFPPKKRFFRIATLRMIGSGA